LFVYALFLLRVGGRSFLAGLGCSLWWNERQDEQKVSVHNAHRSAEQRNVPQSEHWKSAERPHVAPSASSRLRTSTTPQHVMTANDYTIPLNFLLCPPGLGSLPSLFLSLFWR
jgi:hypothetical protein